MDLPPAVEKVVEWLQSLKQQQFVGTESRLLTVFELLKGVVYKERHPLIWQDLLNLQGGVRDYFSVIGLNVLIDESEGFAFLRQAEDNNSDD